MADYKSNGYKPEAVEYHDAPSNTDRTTPKKGGKVKQHFRKFWWLHLINFAIGTLVLSLLLTYVALPKIAQSDVNKAEMFVNEQILSDPTPDSFKIHVKSTVKTHTLFTPLLDAFNASLFLENTEPDIKPFCQITIPSVHASKLSTSDVEQTVKVLDMEQFKLYNQLVLSSKEFRFGLRGRTKVHLGALPVVTVDFNKAPTMKGLNALNGIEIRDVKISLAPNREGNNMEATIMIPNPSVMTLTLGDVVQDIYLDGKLIGNATINNIVLRPGENVFSMASAADQIAVITKIQADPSKSGVLPVEAKARTVSYNGKRLEYFEYAMSQVPIKLNLNLKEPLKAIGLDIFGP